MTSSSSKADKRLLAASVLIFATTCLVAVIVLQSRTNPGDNTPPQAATRQTTTDAIAADLTRLPQATPLAGQLAEDITTIETLIKDCPDYTNERRTQIALHIGWLRDPATLSSEMIIALGGNATEGLLRGVGTFTLSDWGLKDQSETSCLLPIGQQINRLIVEAGGEAIPAFEGVAE